MRSAPPVPPEIRDEIVDLIRARPGALLQHECVALLAGTPAPPAIRRDPRYGRFTRARKGAVQQTIRALLVEGELELGRGDRLEPAT